MIKIARWIILLVCVAWGVYIVYVIKDLKVNYDRERLFFDKDDFTV